MAGTQDIIASIFGQFEDFLRKVGNMDIFDTLVYNYRLKLSSNLNYADISDEFIDLFSQLVDKLTDLRNNLIQWNSIQEFTFSVTPTSNDTFANIIPDDDLHKISPPLPDCFRQPVFIVDDVVSDLLTQGNEHFEELYSVQKIPDSISSAQDEDDKLTLLEEEDTNVTVKSSNEKKKLFLCHICPKEYSTSQSLKAHLNVHQGVKYPCKFCSKTFSRKDKQIFHESVHTGVKSFTCEFCGRGFSRKTKLDEHLRRHSGVKKYKCLTCNKSYASNRDLRNHVKSHEYTNSQNTSQNQPQNFQEFQEQQPIQQQLVQEDDITSEVSEIFMNWSEFQQLGTVQDTQQLDYNIV